MTNADPDTTRIDTALRALDAAPPAPLDHAARVRARNGLDGILTHPRTPGGRDPLLPRRPRTARRVGALAAAAGVVALGMGTSHLGGGGTAYAESWAPVPRPAGTSDAALAREACVEDDTLTNGYHVDRLQTRLAERRGDLVLVVLDEGSTPVMTLSCIVDLPPGGDASFIAGGGGGQRRPAAASVTDAGVYEQTTRGDELAVIDGLVGDDVAAVTVHAPGGRTVQATVQDGHYAAWWPGRAMRLTTTPPAGQGQNCDGPCSPTTYAVPTYTLDVTLRDGTVLRDVPGQPL